MSAESDFLNDALGQIGASRISSIDDAKPEANWCKIFWPKLRQALIRTSRWNFSEDRMQLAQAAGNPAFEFAFWYTLPSYIMRVNEYNGSLVNTSAVMDFGFWWPGRYKREGTKLLSNDGEVKITFNRDIDNPALYDPLFYQLASTWLASKLALAIPKDERKSKELLAQAQAIWNPLALGVGGQEATELPYVSDDLLWGR